jgi:diguanylate cyclase (GGDEF)-like protein
VPISTLPMARDGVTSWLCPGEGERERALDMESRLKPWRTSALAVFAAALVISAPWMGWWTLVPLGVTAGFFALAPRDLERAPRPEYRMFLAWLVAEVAIAAGIALSGGPKSPAVPWLALPVVTLGARFSRRGLVAGTGLAVALLLAATLPVHPDYVLNHPPSVVFPLALVFGIALLSLSLMESDRQFRSAAVIDPLTSMLNRNALRGRVAELTHQATVIHQPIAIVVADVDGFKQINDTHGHATGDAVLRDVAYRFRKRLRAFDLAYRLGGEEFVILLPGADAAQATGVAEGLRAAIADEPLTGLEVTMSFGVSASEPGTFDYDSTFRAADQAMYEAKAMGRNQVFMAESPAGYGRDLAAV